MKTILPMLLACTWITGLWAQPANDDCAGAQVLTLSTPAQCPSSMVVTNTFNSSNLGATPTVPYPALNSCAVGGSTNSPAAEVWYRFTATTNKLTLTISGDLHTPNMILFTGANCTFLNPIYCARDDSGQDSLSVTLSLVSGTSYYLMVSGSTVAAQGDFTLKFTSFRDCAPCLQSAALNAFPPPVNGVYSAGQEVMFCLTLEGWNVTGTVEWLHSIEVELGPAWDMNTLHTIAPPSCGGDGYWAWYDSWTSCNTGNTFGPGFAYDSESGLGCNGFPGDGNPGNNWGDGTNACANITPANPFHFCWTATVLEPLPDSTDHNLNVKARVFSDGDSGSWSQTGCNGGIEYQILASAIPFTDLPPLAFARAPSCAVECSGQLYFSGTSAIGDTLWNYTIFNGNQEIIHQSFDTEGIVRIDSLCTGFYTVLITNPLTGSSRAIEVEVPTPGISWIQDQEIGCEDLVTTYSVGVPDTSLTYSWIFEGGQPATASGAEVAVSYPNAGIYAAMLVAGNGICSDTIREEQAITILNKPVADFDLNIETATVFCSNASQYSTDYFWDFGDGQTSTTLQPSHTYSESGDYLVQLIASNACGLDTFSQVVQITIVHTGELRQHTVFNLYPNPNNGRFTLELEATPAPLAELKIFDALGQIVDAETLGFQSGKLQKTIVQESFSSGVYWLSIKTQDFNMTRKVIVQY